MRVLASCPTLTSSPFREKLPRKELHALPESASDSKLTLTGCPSTGALIEEPSTIPLSSQVVPASSSGGTGPSSSTAAPPASSNSRPSPAPRTEATSASAAPKATSWSDTPGSAQAIMVWAGWVIVSAVPESR